MHCIFFWGKSTHFLQNWGLFGKLREPVQDSNEKCKCAHLKAFPTNDARMFAYCGECWMTCYITCMLFIVRVIGVGHRWLIALPGIFTRRYLEVSLTSSNLILCGWVVVRVVVFFFKKTNNRFCSLLPNSFGFHFCEWVETYLNFLGVKKDAQAKKIQDTAIYAARQTLKYELEANLGSVGSIFELTT